METKCNYCDADIYLKVKQYSRPILAPLTPEDEIMQNLTEKTGWKYIQIAKKYCPMCGKEIT